MKPEDFIGLSKKESQNLAEKKNLIYRLVSIDGEKYFGYPPENEFYAERVCVELKDNKVVKATFQ